MKKLILLSVASLAAVLFFAACELKEPCDPGQEFKYGLCIQQEATEPPGGGGSSGCEAADGGAGGAVECIQPPNAGEMCTEGGDECVGGAVCGAPQLPECVALCGTGDPFEESCPEGLSCLDVGQASVCF